MWGKIRRKQGLIGLILLAIAVSGGFFYYHNAKQKENVPVETVAVIQGSIVSTVAATGTVKPANSVDITSQIAAQVKEIKVKENDYVKAGQVLAILEERALETTVEQARYQVNNTSAKYKRAEYLHSIGAKSQADLEDALLNYQTAMSSYAEGKSNLDKTVILSPMNGVVLGEPVSVGTVVTAGVNNPTVIMMIGDVSSKKVKVKVDETDIGKVKAGQLATFTVDAYTDKTFSGKVEQISQISTSTTTVSSSSASSSSSSSSSSTSGVIYYYVTLTVDDPENLLKTEMTARVNIKVAEKQDALLIPLSALKTSANGQYVTILRPDGKRENVSVTVGLMDSDKVEVLSGVAAGDQLVVSYTKSPTASAAKKDNGPPPPM
ncbi:MAG: efflux RND transporter periplasmic adaptor subunit [Sporomusaceae bacterium]|nr:efflux RND transporter periplasmic adaptor subunit [Sporomusaceae bacterium]